MTLAHMIHHFEYKRAHARQGRMKRFYADLQTDIRVFLGHADPVADLVQYWQGLVEWHKLANKREADPEMDYYRAKARLYREALKALAS